MNKLLEIYADILDLLARIAISLLFLINGYSKIIYFDGTVGWMESYGLPSFFIYPAILLEILAPILLILGFKTKICSILLAGFCTITAIIFLNDFSDQSQLNGFFKNIGLSAGFIFLAINGSKNFSLDSKFEK
tara:strand:+ start:1448 stop:1846 length:399 start_codon:yes stop_codon:yes gene_type:complete